MAKRGKKKTRKPSERREARKEKKPKIPLIERTDARGLVELNFPGFEITFPATNRSIMVIAVAAFCMLTIVIPVVFYQIFNAEPEALETVGGILGSARERGPKDSAPMKLPVKGSNGDIEIIEVCPPCPVCECLDDDENYNEPPPTQPPTVAPPKQPVPLL
jgi:hypothetical protein